MLAEFRTLIRTGTGQIAFHKYYDIFYSFPYFKYIYLAGIELNEVALSDELLCCFLQARQNKLDCAFDLVIF